MFVPDTSSNADSEFLNWESISPPLADSNTSTSVSITSRQDGSFSGGKAPRTLAPNLTRRSHKKSRAGCFTCKTRKIKCGEQKPRCANCVLKGLDCIYPTGEQTRRRESSMPLARRNPAGVTGSPATSSFTMLDMRFFHHFLTTAYPHLPIGNDHVWVNEIPQFAENHEYLMHAILSLGASHLSRLTGTDYRKESFTHRGQAIAGLNLALSQPAKHYGESDAMLAACYALTFQASYMGDGLADFITMVRGCALTTSKIQQEDVPTAFNLQPNWHFKVMAPRLANLPRVNPILCESGIRALEEVGPILSNEVDLDFHQSLIEVLEALLASPQGGYLQFAGLYAVWYELCHDSFKSFLDPANLTAQLLLSYFVGLQMMMVPLAVYEWPDRADAAKSRVLSGTVEWAVGIFNRIELADSPLQRHLEWPRRVMDIVTTEINGGWLADGVHVLQLDLPITPASNSTEDGDGDDDSELVEGLSGGGAIGGRDWKFWDDTDVGGGGRIIDTNADDRATRDRDEMMGLNEPLLALMDETIDLDANIDMM